MQETQVWSLVQEDALEWQPIPVFLPGEFYGQRILMGHSPWGRKRVGHNLGTKQQPQIQDLVPWPEIEPRAPALGAQSLSLWTTRKVPKNMVLNF